mgnify:CR=1 FL=1
MYVRLGIANPKEGMAQDALNYFRDVSIPVYDQVSGLLGAAACINNKGQLMAWTTWANNEAKEAAMKEFQENLSGLAEFITEPPTIIEGPMVAGQQYTMVPKDGEEDFFARFVLGGGTQEVLGSYLIKNLSFKTTILCTGGAISFFTGEQAPINNLIDRFYLGWLIRLIFNPIIFYKRYLLW